MVLTKLMEEEIYNSMPTNKQEDNLREEFYRFGKEASPNNMPATFDDIADWWLEKLSAQKTKILEMIEEVFKERCIVNKDGHCKYWNRDEKNNSYADDKFFPHELLSNLKEKIEKEL